MSGASYICDPGAPRGLTPEQMAERCKCGHERGYHWWGSGPCECGGRFDGRGCDHFRPRKEPSTVPDNQNITTDGATDVA